MNNNIKNSRYLNYSSLENPNLREQMSSEKTKTIQRTVTHRGGGTATIESGSRG